MKDLLSKKHYYYKIHALLMKNKAYISFYRQPPYMGYHPPTFTKNSWYPFYDF